MLEVENFVTFADSFSVVVSGGLFRGMFKERVNSPRSLLDAMERVKEPLQNAIDSFNGNSVKGIANDIKRATENLCNLRRSLSAYTNHRRESIGLDDLNIRQEDINAIEDFIHDAAIKLQQYREYYTGKRAQSSIGLSESRLEEFASVFNKFENELAQVLEASHIFKEEEKNRDNNKVQIFSNHAKKIRSRIPNELYKLKQEEVKDILRVVVNETPRDVITGFVDTLEHKKDMPDFLSDISNDHVDKLIGLAHVWQANQDPFAPYKMSMGKTIESMLPTSSSADPFDNIDVTAFKRDIEEAFQDVYGTEIEVVPLEKPQLYKRKVTEFLLMALLSMFRDVRNLLEGNTFVDEFGSLLKNSNPTYKLLKKYHKFLSLSCKFLSLQTYENFNNRLTKIVENISFTKFCIKSKVKDEAERLMNMMLTICKKPSFVTAIL